MSSVKGIFPSISMKRKPKNQHQLGSSASQLTPTSTSQSQIFRPLTPEASRKVVSGDPVFESKAFDGQLALHSSVNAKENDGETLESFHITSPLPFAESKVASRSPRSQSRSSNHRESLTSVHDRTGSMNSDQSVYSDLVEAPMVDQEDIIALTYHVRAFSEALGALRNTFFEESESPDDKPPEVKAHERLGEVLSILKGVLNQYQPLHSTDILAAAGTLISKVKSHNYEECDQAPEEFCESIDQLALAFSSSVSDFLMGDQDIPLSASRDNSRSLEDFADDDEDDEEDEGDDIDDEQDDDDYRRGFDKKESAIDKSAQKADELDKTLFGLEHGVDLTLQRTKVWSKYSKDIATYLERRAHLELEFTNKLAKLAQATRASITEDRHLPFQTIYVTSLDQDIDYAENCARTYNSLLSSKFLEPLQNRRTYHEKKRKDLKELWTKAYKKLNEAIVKLEKAKQSYVQKQQEIEKFRSVSDAKDGQDASSSFTRTQKKKQDDVRKADEAEDWYKQCVAEANVRQRELLKTKSHVLIELRQLIYQCDQTMKAVTCNFFQLMHSQSTPTPIRFQSLAEISRTYEPGCQFSDFVYEQRTSAQPSVEREFVFEHYTSSDKQSLPTRSNSERALHSPSQEFGRTSPLHTGRNNNLSSSQPVKAWTHALQEHMSDAESTGSKSAPVTPEGSPVTRHKNRLHQSLNEDSSDDESTTEEVRPTKSKGSGPFQNCRMSAAAKTHKFKKLRAPSKCRDCDSYVYFNGAECADCGLTCHRKCLARIKNHCDKKRGTGSRSSDYNGGRRMTTFGVDFYSHLQATHKEDVPYIVSLCVEEINNRGLDIKGIYRVSGVKSKVEKVCQVFENSSGTVDLSYIPPHVIAAVLKLYLRQLPEPLLTFNLYPEFIKIAKESLDVANDDVTSNEYKEVLRKLREVVVKLPRANFKTACEVVSHLKLIANNAEENQMSACNLGIIFGPTLLRPRESATTDSISMSALVDMPHQTKAVELLINNPQVFDAPGVDDPASQQTPVEDFGREKSESIPIDVCSVRKRDSKSSLPESEIVSEDSSMDTLHDETLVVIPNQIEPEKPVQPDKPVNHDTNIINDKITPTPPYSRSSMSSTASSPSKSLGFDNGFLDLLVKSNNRTESDKEQEYSVPEFLLPGSTDEQEQNDKDAEDSYDDSIQGTSGFCTPDDNLGSSSGSIPRDDVKSEEPNEPTSPTLPYSALSSSRSMPDIAGMSRSSSNYSITTTVSFGSEIPDEKLLPDCSESTESAPKIPELPLENPSGYVRPYPKKTVDDSSVPSRTRRPHALGLFKRNSDLPGMMSRLAFLSSGSKPPGSGDVDESKKSKEPPRTPEEVLLNPGFSPRKLQGVTEALRTMHVVYDPVLQHAEKPIQTTDDVETGPDPVVKETPNDVKASREREAEPVKSKEWYISEQNDIHEMDNQENTIDFEPTENQESNKVDDVAATGSPVRNQFEKEPVEEKQMNSLVSGFESAREKTVEKEKSISENVQDVCDVQVPRTKEEADFSVLKEKKPLCPSEKPSEVLPDESKAFNEDKTKGEFQEKPRSSQRVSVKDRRRNYEKTPDSNDEPSETSEVSRKPQSPFGNFDIASRKQMFESSEKGAKKDTYKTLSDISRKAKSGSLNSSREELDQIERETSPRMDFDRLDHGSQENISESKEPTKLWSRRVDISLDDATNHQDNGEDQKKNLRVTNSFPLTRTSPKLPRRARRHFPEEKTQEDREPQFV